MTNLLQKRLPPGYGRGVSIPKSFQVGLPRTLAKLLSGWQTIQGATQIPEIPGLEGQWLEVSGGPLPTRVLVRVDRAEDDRLVITGLLLGWRDRQEITWETLRQIKPASLLEWIFAGFNPMNPAAGAFESDRGQTQLALWKVHHSDAPSVTVGGRPGTPDLQLFADTYRRHLAVTPHKAMKATSEELGISRATGIRRADKCRAIGLLPPKGSRS